MRVCVQGHSTVGFPATAEQGPVGFASLQQVCHNVEQDHYLWCSQASAAAAPPAAASVSRSASAHGSVDPTVQYRHPSEASSGPGSAGALAPVNPAHAHAHAHTSSSSHSSGSSRPAVIDGMDSENARDAPSPVLFASASHAHTHSIKTPLQSPVSPVARGAGGAAPMSTSPVNGISAKNGGKISPQNALLAAQLQQQQHSPRSAALAASTVSLLGATMPTLPSGPGLMAMQAQTSAQTQPQHSHSHSHSHSHALSVSPQPPFVPFQVCVCVLACVCAVFGRNFLFCTRAVCYCLCNSSVSLPSVFQIVLVS